MSDTAVHRVATLDRFTRAVGAAEGVHLRELTPMTALEVRTQNSRYEIIIASAHEVLVEGGRFFPQLTEATLSGSTLGGSFLKAGWIGIGLRMEIVVGERRIVTSPVRGIRRLEAPGRVH